MKWLVAILLTLAIQLGAVMFYAALEFFEPRGRDLYVMSIGAVAAIALFRTFYRPSDAENGGK